MGRRSVEPRALVLAALAAVAVPPGLVTAQEVGPAEGSVGRAAVARPHFDVAPATSTIDVDGRLDEAAWRDATSIDIAWEWFPGENVEPPVRTVCLVAHDERNLYVGFLAYDPDPASVRAHLWDRDQIENFVADDHVSLIIDTFGDNRRAFQFRVNPLGVQADAINSFVGARGSEDWSWDAIWNSAGRITGDGYVVEIALPFNQLRFSGDDGPKTWGFIAGRSYPRTVRHRINSMPIDRNEMCLLCQASQITGMEGITPGRNLEIDPTVTSIRTDRVAGAPGGGLEKGDADVEPGLTMHWGITPNLTLSGAANPDFSHVEADVAQLDVNTRFALFFPEKRPFFLEGVDTFQTPMQAVYTRTVADPEVGVKLTGKVGRSAIGAFVTRDRVTNLVFPGNQRSLYDQISSSVDGGVFRYRYDLGSGSTLGALATAREGDGYHNRLYGVDGFIRVGSTNFLEFQALGSDTRYPDGVARRNGQPLGSFDGRALQGLFVHNSRHWVAWAYYGDRDPGFRADQGFIPRVDVRTVETNVGRIFWGEEDDFFSRIQVSARYERTEDHAGLLTDEQYFGELFFSGPLQSVLAVHGVSGIHRFAGREFDVRGGGGFLQVRPLGWLNLTLHGWHGDGIDYANVRPGRELSLGSQVGFNVGRRTNVTLWHRIETMSHEGERVFAANLAQARLMYLFSSRAFVRAIAQYRHVDRDPALFDLEVPETDESLFTQLLFSYKINPKTVLFLGYSDNSVGSDGAPLDGRGFDLTRTDRTFFLKVGYAWVL